MTKKINIPENTIINTSGMPISMLYNTIGITRLGNF